MQLKRAVLVAILVIGPQTGCAESGAMDAPRFDPRKVVVIGHRGAAASAPENTVAGSARARTRSR